MRLITATLALATALALSAAPVFAWSGCKVGAFAGYAITHTTATATTPLAPISATIDGLSTENPLGGRAGILVTPTTLVYGTVGWTEAKADPLALIVNGTGIGSISVPDAKGWFLGGGFESEVAKRVYLSMEYRFARFDDRNIAIIPGVADLGLDTDQHQIRVGLAFKFGPSDATAFAPTK